MVLSVRTTGLLRTVIPFHGSRINRLRHRPERPHSTLTVKRDISPSAGSIWRSFSARLLCKADAEAVEAEDLVEVDVEVVAEVEFGLSLKICGSCESLGNWELGLAPSLDWTEGNIWTTRLKLPRKQIEAKCVAVSDNDSEYTDWEQGANRLIELPEDVRSNERVKVSLEFKSSEEPTITVLQVDRKKESEAESVAPDSEKGEIPAVDSSGVASHLTEDESEATQPGEETKIEAATETDAAAGSTGDSTKENQLEEVPVTAKSVQVDSPIEAPKSNLTEQAPSPTSAQSPEETADRLPVGGKVQTTKASEAEPDKENSREVQEVKRSVGSGGKATGSEGETTKGIPIWLSALGFVSIPITIWSEFKLYTTGCGLPPGPAGLLGAAEGISYLAVIGIAAWILKQRIFSKSGETNWPISLEIGSVATISIGIFVLISQIATYGYIPSALPDQNCPAQPTSIETLFNS